MPGLRRPLVPVRRRHRRGRRLARPRSTSGRGTTSTWAWPGPPTCPWSWSATSTAAGCWPRCTARWRCSTTTTRPHQRGWVVNKFRGDLGLLRPGCACSRSARTARSSGCCPTCTDVWLDAEDSLALAGWSEAARRPRRGRHAVRGGGALPPDLQRHRRRRARRGAGGLGPVTADPPRWRPPTWWCSRGRGRRSRTWPGCGRAASPGGAGAGGAAAPGARHLRGLPDARRHGGRLRRGRVAGAGQRPRPRAAADAGPVRPGEAAGHPGGFLARPGGDGLRDPPRRGHLAGRAARTTAEPAAEPFLDGWNVGATYGTTWHGAFENDGFRRAFLAEVARLTGVSVAARARCARFRRAAGGHARAARRRGRGAPRHPGARPADRRGPVTAGPATRHRLPGSSTPDRPRGRP